MPFLPKAAVSLGLSLLTLGCGVQASQKPVTVAANTPAAPSSPTPPPAPPPETWQPTETKEFWTFVASINSVTHYIGSIGVSSQQNNLRKFDYFANEGKEKVRYPGKKSSPIYTQYANCEKRALLAERDETPKAAEKAGSLGEILLKMVCEPKIKIEPPKPVLPYSIDDCLRDARQKADATYVAEGGGTSGYLSGKAEFSGEARRCFKQYGN